MKCPFCNRRMRYDASACEYHCSNCNSTVKESELWEAVNAEKINENFDDYWDAIINNADEDSDE